MKNKLYLLLGAVLGVVAAMIGFWLGSNRVGAADSPAPASTSSAAQTPAVQSTSATTSKEDTKTQPESETTPAFDTPPTEPNLANSGSDNSDGTDFLREAYTYRITLAPPIKSFYSKYKGKHSDVKYVLSDLNFSYCLDPQELRNIRNYWNNVSKDFTCVNHKHYYHLDGGDYTVADVNQKIAGNIIWWLTDIKLLSSKKFESTTEDAATAYTQLRELLPKYLKAPQKNNQDGKLWNGLAERTIVYTETTDKVLHSQILVGEEKRVFPSGEVMYFSAKGGDSFKYSVVEKYQSLFIGRINKLATARLQREVYFDAEYSYFKATRNGILVSVYDQGADKRSTSYEYLYLPSESFNLDWFVDSYRVVATNNRTLLYYFANNGKEEKVYFPFYDKYFYQFDAEGNRVHKWISIEDEAKQQKKK